MNGLRIRTTDHFTIEQARDYALPGYLIVSHRGEKTNLADFTPEEGRDLFECLAWAERRVREIVGPERIYFLKFGEEVPRIHFHVVPRTQAVETAYLSDNDDSPPISGARFVDWLWRRHESLGHAPEEIEAFVRAAREGGLT